MYNKNDVLNTYDKQSKLNYREKKKKKLHVYFGSRDEIHHPIREQFNNAFDEISSNFKEGHIFAELSNNDRTFTIEDTGRGMPLPIEEDGFKYWESMFLTLFSGGKYENNVNDNNGGTNGVGNACTNFTSNKFECTSYFMGEEWYISFKDGGRIDIPLTNKGKTNKHGTRISFELDDRVYTTEPIFDFNVIKEYVYKCSASFPNIDTTLKHEDEIVEINKKDSDEYFKHNAKLDNYLYLPKKELMSKYTDTETGKKLPQKDTITAYFYPVCENVFQQTNLNGIWLRDNGYIYDGIIDGIKNYVNEYCNKERLFKGKEKEIKKEDVICSVSFIVDFTSSNVSYEGQTKFLTKSLLYKQETRDSIYEILEIIMNENKEDFDKLVKQCLLSMRARLRADEARKGKKNNTKTIEKPDIEKLYDMTSFPRDLCEEYVVEGTSAGGSAKNASDKRFQAVLPTKGKILNVEKQTLDKVIGSETLKTFSNGIGLKLGEKYDKSKLRFGKIIIMSDAD